MENMQYLIIAILHLAMVGAGLSAWTEKVPAYRFFASLFAGAFALVIWQTAGWPGLAAMLVGLLVVVPAVLSLGSKLIHRAAAQKGFPSQWLTIAGASRYIWSLQ